MFLPQNVCNCSSLIPRSILVIKTGNKFNCFPFFFPGEEKDAPSSPCSLVPSTDNPCPPGKWRTGALRTESQPAQQEMQPESRSSCQIQTLPRCSSTCEKTGKSVTTAFTLKAILCPYKWMSLINFFFLFRNRLPDVPLIPVMLSPSVLRGCLKSPSRALFKERFGLFLMGVF